MGFERKKSIEDKEAAVWKKGYIDDYPRLNMVPRSLTHFQKKNKKSLPFTVSSVDRG